MEDNSSHNLLTLSLSPFDEINTGAIPHEKRIRAVRRKEEMQIWCLGQRDNQSNRETDLDHESNSTRRFRTDVNLRGLRDQKN